MKIKEIVTESLRQELEERKKKRKKKTRYAAWGPGPYGMYGTAIGYSGSDGAAGDGGAVSGDGGGVGETVSSNATSHQVVSGDTLFNISQRYQIPIETIKKINNLKTNNIQLGQILTLKQPTTAKKTTAQKSVTHPTKQTTVNTPKKTEPVTRKGQAAMPAPTSTLNRHEALLVREAKKAGMVGDELAQFLAQCAHETHDFNSLVEYGGSLDFRKYDPKYAPKKARALGNRKPGDGARYKGRGYIQLTGRYNYKKAGEALGLPLEQKPELVERPDVAAKVAVWYWKSRVRPKVDDFSNTTNSTKPINPGLNGLEDRKQNFKDYKMTLAAI